jgi:hypothetical protein
LFFNKEGYPYNFTYDETNKEWNGKIYFDENGSDTFRTICLYVFENVKSYELTDIFDLRASQLFNWSGMTFVPYTQSNETIIDIRKVNENQNFYSKWIIGDRFDKKFPIGTVVAFSDITGNTLTNEFHQSGVTYYNVLGNQKDAFLITTLTNNKDFDFVFSGGTVSSISILKSPDYGNQNLVDMNNLGYYNGKKISISGSEYNDGVYTYTNYNVLKTKVYDFLLSPETYLTGSTMIIEFYLMTQRPELYEGNIKINYDGPINDPTGTTIEFYNYINTNVDFSTTGQTFIFEKPDGTGIDLSSNPEFTITGFVDRKYETTDSLNFYVSNGINIIESLTGVTGLTYNDQIELIATPYITGNTLHDKRQFQILNVTGNKIQVREYVIPESGYTYQINKVIKKNKVQKLYCTRTGVSPIDVFTGYTICYSTSNKITMSQDIIYSGTSSYFYENTVTSMRNKYKTLLDRYGLNLYHYHYSGYNYMIFDGLDYNWRPYYTGVTARIDSNYLDIGNNFTYLSGATYMDSDVFYFSTKENFKKFEKIYHYDYDKLAKNFSSEIYLELKKDSTNYGFKVNINDIEYFVTLSGDSSTYTIDTINSFVNIYESVLKSKGINVYSGYTYDKYTGYTITFQGIQPNIILYDITAKVNSYSTLDFLHRTTNKSIVVSSDELYLVDTGKTLYDYELATGMLINISGCTNSYNNKQYNILRVTSNIIQLSYQGPFSYEYNKSLTILINDFLRTPRGSYNRDTNYRFSWLPIEGNVPQVTDDIFFYDYTGSQLKNNGNLTYLGQKPLWNVSDNNLVFLNREPNNTIDNIYNPEYQQTVFDELTFELEKLNSTEYYNFTPVPMQVFIGFNSKNEGVSTNTMIIEKIDGIIFSGTTGDNGDFLITGSSVNYYSNDPYFDFNSLGFEVDQHVYLNFEENTLTGHTIYGDYGTYKITDVTNKYLKVDGNLPYFDSSLSGKTYDFIIKTMPDMIATIKLYGQTEIEDIRYVQHLKLLGAKLESDAQPIFKESDINEVGIDYTILNRKRKELLEIYPEIYNYIGSYKALINSINYFGYNDLDLYEYYRCVKPNSPLYGKLQKALIEDIFINEIPGWDEPEIDNVNYLKTNLFNLTYKITDFEGNYLDLYSLSEVQIKLTKLVQWLRKNMIPLSSNILDITGLSQVRSTAYVNFDSSNFVKKVVVNQDMSVVNFNYIQTLNIDTNYLFTINFYLTNGSVMPEYWTGKIKTFHLNEVTNELEPVQYMDLYKTDLLSYSFNVDKNIDPYMYIETQSYNEYGLGYTNYKLFNYNEGRNFILVNNNFNWNNYKYVTDNYGYYMITDGRFYVIKY